MPHLVTPSAATSRIEYPFEPRSTRLLRPGQFWAVPLSNGRFACGRVLQLWGSRLFSMSRGFFGGLHDWVGDAPPTAADVASSPIVEHGVMHIRAITRTGGVVLGCRALEADGVEVPLFASAHGVEAELLRGADAVRPLAADEAERYPMLAYWGFAAVQVHAERRFVSSGRSG